MYDERSKLDELLRDVREYRTGDDFIKLLEFCAKFKTLAPYNSMLVRFQMPGARYVLTASEWRQYRRIPRPNARPLVVLFPFGPVNFVFEIGDTMPIDPKAKNSTDEQILEELAAPYRTKGKIDRRIYNNLIKNLQYHSILFDPQLFAASGLSAKIGILKQNILLNIQNNKELHLTWPAAYLLSTNHRASNEEVFAGIAHELGHFFCQHLPAPEDWRRKRGNKFEPAWKERDLSPEAMEFEAESVAWLICDRVNIENPSKQYLSHFIGSDLEIPEGVSLERIFNAFNHIWEMCTRDIFWYQDGLLYKYNKEFQKLAKKENDKYNEQHRRR